jgi:hypothetical protein
VRFIHVIPLSIASLGFVVGCTSIDSTDIRTSGITPSFTVSSSSGGNDSSVGAVLKVGDSATDFVELEGGDKLSVTVGDNTQDLSESKILGTVSYNATINTQEPGTEVIIAFTRTETDESAPASKVTLGEKLTLATPTAGSAFSRANDDIVVSWTSDASDDPVRVTISGSCIQDASRDVQAGETSVTLAKGSILKKEQAEGQDPIPDSCDDVTVRVARTHAGTPDPAFEGGSIQHVYSAEAQITSNL